MSSNVSLLHEVGNDKSNKSGSKRKLKVSTVDIQIKRSGLKISNSKDFSSEFIVQNMSVYDIGFVAKTITIFTE